MEKTTGNSKMADFEKLKLNWKKLLTYLLITIGTISCVWILVETIRQNNLGFDKSLWDWMELLLVPVALAVAGYLFSRFQKKTELEIAKKERAADRELALERQRQNTLEKYLDRIKELILDRGLDDPDVDEKVKRLARALTINVLCELDGVRNNLVIQFLRESSLIQTRGDKPEENIISLNRAYLSKADLSGVWFGMAQMIGVDLSEANLRGANLGGTNLREASFRKADLTGAVLLGATLENTDFTNAILVGANLREANLCSVNPRRKMTDLRGANLSNTNLYGTNLKGVLYNNETTWPVGFDPIATGINLVNE